MSHYCFWLSMFISLPPHPSLPPISLPISLHLCTCVCADMLYVVMWQNLFQFFHQERSGKGEHVHVVIMCVYCIQSRVRSIQVLSNGSNPQVVTTFTTSEKGNFCVHLPLGEYRIKVGVALMVLFSFCHFLTFCMHVVYVLCVVSVCTLYDVYL